MTTRSSLEKGWDECELNRKNKIKDIALHLREQKSGRTKIVQSKPQYLVSACKFL